MYVSTCIISIFLQCITCLLVCNLKRGNNFMMFSAGLYCVQRLKILAFWPLQVLSSSRPCQPKQFWRQQKDTEQGLLTWIVDLGLGVPRCYPPSVEVEPGWKIVRCPKWPTLARTRVVKRLRVGIPQFATFCNSLAPLHWLICTTLHPCIIWSPSKTTFASNFEAFQMELTKTKTLSAKFAPLYGTD